MANSKEEILANLKEFAKSNPAAAMFLSGASIDSMYALAKDQLGDVSYEEFKKVFEELSKYLKDEA